MKKNYLKTILENKYIKIYSVIIIYITILVSVHFNFNNSLIFSGIIFEDIIYLIIFDITLILLATLNIKKYNLNFILNNKIWLSIIILLVICYFNNSDFNYIKLIIYIIPLLLINELKSLYSLVNFNKILFILKVSFFLILVLLILEHIIFHYYQTTLENIIFDNDIYSYQVAIKVSKEHYIEHFFDEIKSNIGFRPKLFLSNPITIYINCVLISIILIHYTKTNRYLIIVLKIIIGLLCKTRLILITPLFFMSDIKNIFYEKKITQIFIYILFSIIILSATFFIFDFEDFKIQQIYNSRIIFYIQFLEQYNNYLEILLPKKDIYFYNISGNLTGPHSDFIYLTVNFGILISFMILYKIFLIIRKLESMSLIILLILFFNGIIFNSFFWITIYLITIYENINNNTNYK